MAKAFYGIDMQGKFLIERRTANPTAEEGRIFLRTDTNAFYGCADGSNNRKIVIEDGGSYNISPSGSLNADNLDSGTVPVARLTGLYNINISGNAATATLADEATSAKYS